MALQLYIVGVDSGRAPALERDQQLPVHRLDGFDLISVEHHALAVRCVDNVDEHAGTPFCEYPVYTKTAAPMKAAAFDFGG